MFAKPFMEGDFSSLYNWKPHQTEIACDVISTLNISKLDVIANIVLYHMYSHNM